MIMDLIEKFFPLFLSFLCYKKLLQFTHLYRKFISSVFMDRFLKEAVFQVQLSLVGTEPFEQQ